MDSNENDLVMLLAAAGPCSLDSSPKKNWVERAGHLPNYICHIAKAVMRGGRSKGQAISIAIGRCKVWAAGGGGVNADTRAKAAKAIAQWEALKAKNAAKKMVKASTESGEKYIMLTDVGSFATEMVRNAWYAKENSRIASDPGTVKSINVTSTPSRGYIRELWTDFIIVDFEEAGDGRFMKVPYTVSGADVNFEEPVPVLQEWVEMDDYDELTEEEMELLSDLMKIKRQDPEFMEKVLTIAGQG